MTRNPLSTPNPPRSPSRLCRSSARATRWPARAARCIALSLAASLPAFAIACGLTADFSGLQTGRPSDAATAADALDGLDAGDAAIEAAAPPFCASLAAPAKLCADFDEGNPIDTGWGAIDTYGGETIRVDKTAFSPPGSFFSAINPSGAPASARLLQTVPTQSPRVHVEFEMLLVPSDGTLELCVLHQVTAGGVTYGFYYQEVNRKLEVFVKSLSSDASSFSRNWPIGEVPSQWTHVAIDVDVADAGTFTVRHDGAIVASATNIPTSTPSRTAMFVELGFYSYVPATGQANFDNVVADWP